MTYQEFTALGYILKTNVTDVLGIPHRLGVYPMSSGGINYFDDLSGARAWLDDVRLIRAMQADDKEFLRRRQNLTWFKAGLEWLCYEPSTGE